MSEHRGYISREYTVWCAVCFCWQQSALAPNMKRAAKIFRLAGWKNTKKRGWVCPKCRGKRG